MGEECATHPLRAFAKQAIQQGVVDKGARHEIAIKREARRLDLVHRVGQSRHEATEESAHAVRGNLPNAEKAQNVVDAVGRKVLGHLDIAPFPPRVTVGRHGRPVVSGETPILPCEREGIGRRAGRTVQVEIMGFGPRLDRTTGNADGNIALEHHPTPPCMCRDLAELCVQKVLHIAIKVVGLSFSRARCEGSCDRLSVIFRMLRPAMEIGRGKFVAQSREGRISRQPLRMAARKGGISLRLQQFAAVCTEREQQKITLELVDPRIVDGRECIEFAKFTVECGLLARVGQGRQGAQVHIHRVEGIDRNGVIRVGIGVFARECGVVNGENLQHSLTGGRCPVDHAPQIAEIADSLTAFTAQGKHRNGGTGHAREQFGEIDLGFGQHMMLARRESGEFQNPVGARFPMRHAPTPFVDGHQFILIAASEQGGVEGELPNAGGDLVERNGGVLVPGPESTRGAQQGQMATISSQSGREHAPRETAGCQRRGRCTGQCGIAHSRGEQGAVGREVAPAIVDEIRVAKSTFDAQAVRQMPQFTPQTAVALPHSITISGHLCSVEVGEHNLACPFAGRCFAQRKRRRREVLPFEVELLAGSGEIGDSETQFHRTFGY